MNAEMKKVNVLGVLGAMAVVADEMKWPAWVDRSIWERAKVAMAELIELRKEIERIADDFVPFGEDDAAQALDEMRNALKAALARIGGAA